MFVCLHVMFVCYVCVLCLYVMFVCYVCKLCLYVMLLLLDAVLFERQTLGGSSTTPRSDSPNILFSKSAPLFPFVRTIKIPFAVITYNCPQWYANNHVQLLTMSRVFSSFVQITL